jgi:hypothetical protein
MSGMEPDIIRPETTPTTSNQAFSPLGCALAAIGAGLSAFSLVGAGTLAGIWAFSRLLGLPETVLYAMLALSFIPIIWAGVWAGSRAWHVERRLAAGHDVDTPNFGFGYYLRKR